MIFLDFFGTRHEILPDIPKHQQPSRKLTYTWIYPPNSQILPEHWCIRDALCSCQQMESLVPGTLQASFWGSCFPAGSESQVIGLPMDPQVSSFCASLHGWGKTMVSRKIIYKESIFQPLWGPIISSRCQGWPILLGATPNFFTCGRNETTWGCSPGGVMGTTWDSTAIYRHRGVERNLGPPNHWFPCWEWPTLDDLGVKTPCTQAN